MNRSEIHLWFAGLALASDASCSAACARVLSSDERRHWEALRLDRRRREYLLARAMVRTALSERSQRPAASWRFTANEHGRPEVDPPCGLHFSVSHCDRLVVCAVAERELGVDVEPLPRGAEILDLARHVFSRAERKDLARIRDLTGRSEHAVVLWTLKESYLKARGIGLSVPLRSFGFPLVRGQPALRTDRDTDRRWSWASLRLADCVLSLTTHHGGGSPRIVLHDWAPPDERRRDVVAFTSKMFRAGKLGMRAAV
jgi:4'-phosphopantetheinyl transferase